MTFPPYRFDNDFSDGYLAGTARGRVEQARQDRIAAFGAIRRAAAWARYAESEATRPFPIDPPRTRQEERLRLMPAQAIRKAIRAAIGSEKA